MTRLFDVLLVSALCGLPIVEMNAQQAGYTASSVGKYAVTGTLCDSLTRQAEAFATLRLWTDVPKGKVLKVATSQADGSFKLYAPHAGNYVVEAVVLGMKPIRRKISLTADRPEVVLDTLYMQEYSSSLSAATVTAQRQVVKADIDKITYSMTDDPEAQTSSTLDMLRKVPMVTVDGEDNIKVNGSESFKVYVNGKPSQMMSANPSVILKNYPAAAIQRVEVITNPGAKYDAEGTAGVLNIITALHTNTSGYVITPNISIGNRGPSGSLFAMAQAGKFTLSLNYGVGSSNNATMYNSSEREVFHDPEFHLYRQQGNSDGKSIYQYGSLDASYEFSPKDLLTFSAGLHASKRERDNFGNIEMMAENGDFSYGYASAEHSKTKYLGVNTSVDYQHTFRENRNLTLSYRYNVNPQNTKTELRYSDLEQVPQHLDLQDMSAEPDNLSYEHTAQVDFTTDIRKIHTLSAGLKYIYRINRSNNEEWVRPTGTDHAFELDTDASLRYRHRGDIGAAYLEYSLKKNKWMFKAGSRYEYFRAKVNYPDGKRPSFTSEMGDWVPSVSLGYSLKRTMLVKAGYSLRIGRPDISYLSPYEVHNSPETVSYGNPNMGSTKAHNLNLTFSTFTPKLTLNTSLTYSFSKDGFVNYSFMKDGIQHTTYGNFLKSRQTTWSTYLNWTIVKGSSINLNSSVEYNDFKSSKTNEHNSGFEANAWGGYRQILPWRMNFSLWLGGNTKKVMLQGDGAGFFYYSMNLSRNFMKDDRMSVTLKAGNFLGRYRHFRSHTLTEQFRFDSDNRVDFMRFGIGIRYRFGSLKAKVKKAERTIINNDLVPHEESSEEDSSAGAPKS